MDSAYPLGTFAKRIYAGQLASFVLTHPVRLTSVAVAELPDSGENFSPSALKLFCAPFPGSRDLIEDSDDDEEEDEDEDDEDEEDETDAERLTELQGGDELEGESEDSQGDEEDSEEGIDTDDLSDDSDIEEATVTLAWLTSAQLHTKLDIFLPDGEPLGLSIEGHEDLVVDVSGHYVMLPGAESESEFDSDEEDDDDEYDLEPASDEELDMEDDDLSGPNKAYLKLLADSANAEDEDGDDDEEEEDLPPAKPAKASKKRGAAEAGIDTDADMSTASKSGPTEEGLIQLARQAGIPEADVRDMSRNQRKRLAKKIKTGASAGAEDDDELDADEVDGATAKAEKKAAASAKAAAPVAEKKVKAETTKPSKTTTPSGLTIQTMNAPSGTSRTAKAGDRVGMRYVGKLLSTGAQFDANTKGKPFSFKLGKGEVIKGWDEGVKGMRIGEERRLTCPPHLAYGRQKLPGIPANSTLVFDIKLVEIK